MMVFYGASLECVPDDWTLAVCFWVSVIFASSLGSSCSLERYSE